ncbi:MAG: membrane protein insertion efficiency factor YidD [Candidatus Omnitrophota bacterium]
MTEKKAFHKIAENIKKAAIWMLRTYKKAISPLLGSSCRFVPSCSQYAKESLEEYGLFLGTPKALWRILRCNPFSRGGYDPVPRKNPGEEK